MHVTPEEQLVRRVRRRLLSWARTSGRDFWWRHQRDPFVTALVEILLKQTRASSVEQEIRVFVGRYSTPESLASADLNQLITDLTPFGFQRQRASHMKALGTALSSEGRRISANRDDLLRLPGIGPYAASAIRCFVFGKPDPVIDVNIVRIVQRMFGVHFEKGEGRRNAEIKRIALRLLQGRQARQMNWALLDFGALVCTERSPKCQACPLVESCAFASLKAAA